ncbi:MAG: LysR family transcriptional regulator [Oscillospiraceae bacterium]|nr:LysR family transcriptional regulator [Oscillospiraceae bacterium]
MELLQLQYFYEVARNLHVTKTAEQLHVAQPALTQGIRRLERELGVKLFCKSGRNIVLTEYGLYLKEKLTPVLQTLEQIPEHIHEMAGIRKRTLRVNVLAASTMVTEALIKYQQIHDDISFQVVQNVQDINADITVSTIERFSVPENSRDKFRVFTEHIFLAVPNRSEFRSMKEIRLQDLKEVEFISLAGSRTLRVICDRYCMQAGFTPRIVFESDSTAAVQNLIAAGLGVGFWPHYTWGRNEIEGVLLLPIKEPDCRRDIVLQLHYQNGADQKKAEEFFEYLGDYLQNQKKNVT